VNDDRSLHAVTWFVWAMGAGLCVQLAQNPLYVVLILGVAAVVVEAHNAGGLLTRAFPVLVAVGLAFGLFKIALTALTVHGSDSVLVTLPQLTLPRLLGGFTVGGTIEGQVLAQATMEALVIVGVMGVFGAFNAVVSHDELVRSLPRTFHEPGLILTVGLAFVPATIASARAVQESDRCRTGGEPVRRGRIIRSAVPLLESGLERAVSLSESMDSRGFARQAPSTGDRLAGWLALVGLLAFAGLLVALVGGSNAMAAVLAGLGILALVGAVAVGSRRSPRTRYRRRPLTWFDGVVMGSTALALGTLGLLSLRNDGSLGWDVSPLGLPTLAIGPVLAIALLAVPALRPLRRADHEATPRVEPTMAGATS
jgi:energy-coupling factor transport system permease protein